MSEESTKWDKQWSVLLTRCHGEDVQANAEFKSRLLDELKRKTAENLESDAVTDESGEDRDADWRRLLKKSYIPCHPEEKFKTSLLLQLKAKQQVLHGEATSQPITEEDALRAILTKSYQPVSPRREFQTRLLENLKERQRHTTVSRRISRRRTIFMSAVSSVAAAAMVMLVAWVMPSGVQPRSSGSNARSIPVLPIPEEFVADAPQPVRINEFAVVPAVMETSSESGRFGNYRVADAFSGPALPRRAFAHQNIEMSSDDSWIAMPRDETVAIEPGMAFRAVSGTGQLTFDDGSVVTISPDSLLVASQDGLSIDQGFMLVSSPESQPAGFRLHFPERDIAIEAATDLAVMVEPKSKYAEGGAPAPLVMVADRDNTSGGLALARGKNGIGPLFAKQLYRIDKYVTPDLPGRTMCDTECQDLDKQFKLEAVQRPASMASMASFAGNGAMNGFAGARNANDYALLVTPAGFSKKGDRWVADSYSNQTTIKIKYLSDDYFAFANQRRDLAMALALGGRIVIDGGDGSFYEIHK